MEVRKPTTPTPPVLDTGMDHSEEMLAEVDEPPDEVKSRWSWSPLGTYRPTYSKLPPQSSGRRESLLTRQLHSETEHTDEEHVPPPTRALSTQSTFSNPSTTSTAELTSDDGHSIASPGVSPPLAPMRVNHVLPFHDQLLDKRIKIVGQEEHVTTDPNKVTTEKTVEANLGRKRCITFACRGKEETKTTVQPPTAPSAPEKPQAPSSPPKRKCALKFVCPSRAAAESKPGEKLQAPVKRHASPPPPVRRSSANSKAELVRQHRGSDSTVTHASPQSTRTKVVPASPTLDATLSVRQTVQAKFSDLSDAESGNEGTRFHEFATSEDEPEEWVQESTCHRSRLTVSDTLKKENVIRKACEEVEEEVVEEEEEDEAEELEEELEEVAGMDEAERDIADDDDEESDEGFHSDDEEGFANSDSEADDSDYEWWRPGGASTAATSIDALDRLAIVNAQQDVLASSIGSGSSGHRSNRTTRRKLHRKAHNPTTAALPIHNRPASPALPDSTDFVCGTLDEDRPIEQAYINRLKMKQAAKRPTRPQDIDPSFPTSDPEMDEEDDDDVDEVPESEDEDEEEFLHGDLEELHGDEHSTVRPTARTTSNRSPPPAAATRHHSPPPPSKRRSTARSPPPPAPTGRHHSPPPPSKRRTRSPPPHPTRRSTARSSPPRNLFATSPRRCHSPVPIQAPVNPMTSPPNTPTGRLPPSFLLGQRPRLAHTASLPRGGGGRLLLSQMGKDRNSSRNSEDEDDYTSGAAGTAGNPTDIPKRGAIDIVKGLERKRQRRKERLYQKACAKAAAKGEKSHKVKPGKGCERMREVGLQLQNWQGKAEYMLSL